MLIAIKRRLLGCARFSISRSLDGGVFVRAHQLVPTRFHGFNPLSFIAQTDAGHLMEIGLYLKAARVG